MKFKIVTTQSSLNEANMDAGDAMRFWSKKFEKSSDLFFVGINDVKKILSKHKDVNVTEIGFVLVDSGIEWRLKIDVRIGDSQFDSISRELEKVKNTSVEGGFGYQCSLGIRGDIVYRFSGFNNFGTIR